MNYLSKSCKLKDGSVKVPDSYLGADIRVHELSDGRKAWEISSNTYVKRAVPLYHARRIRLVSRSHSIVVG